MSPDEKDISELERALGGLRPARAGFDRDRLMFQAGQASAPRRLLWPAAAGLMTAVAVSLGLFMVLRPAAEPVIEVVYVKHPVVAPQPAPAPPKSPEPQPAPEREGATTPSVLATSSYWRLQEIAVRHGIDALPEPAAPAATGPAPASTTTSVGEWRTRPGMASSLFNAGVE
jgi:hypothetical protein